MLSGTSCQFIRASPEQLRSASMREWWSVVSQPQQSQSQGSSGATPGIRNVVDLLGSGGLPSREHVESEGAAPITESGETRAADLPLPNLPPSPEVLEYSPDALGNTREEGGQPEHEVSPAASKAGDEVPDHEMASASAPDGVL